MTSRSRRKASKRVMQAGMRMYRRVRRTTPFRERVSLFAFASQRTNREMLEQLGQSARQAEMVRAHLCLIAGSTAFHAVSYCPTQMLYPGWMMCGFRGCVLGLAGYMR